jgi:hypothetical protein
MNILILTAETTESLITSQTGQHRLGPVRLTDGRYFLMADVKDEPLFTAALSGVVYTEATFDSIQHLITTTEDDV